jgi:hypothetical protein
MNTRLLDHDILYDGSQLRSGWIAQTAGLTGAAAVAFLGPCEVAREHMVDMVDLAAGARISSPNMVHVIIEHPGLDLHHITTRQRLLMAIAAELINSHLGEALLRREGDDLYLRGRKLSVSVATVSLTSAACAGTAGSSPPAGSAGVSPASGPQQQSEASTGTAGLSLPSSGLIHAGFNLRGEGAPVPAIGLEELGLDPRRFAELLLSAYADEIDSIMAAAAKVKPVL